MTVPIGVPAWRSATGPVTGTPPRSRNSLRRTSSLDMQWPHGATELRLVGRARDLYTGTSAGDGRIVGTAELEMTVDTTDSPVVTSIDTVADRPGIDASGIIGHSPISGFRKALASEFGASIPRGSLIRLLLHEVPIASVVAWSALGRRGQLAAEMERQQTPRRDVCAGWRKDGALDLAVSRGFSLYGIDSPPAPALDSEDDPVAWHTFPPLLVGSMRRRRRMDVTFPSGPSDEVTVDAFFRDAHVNPGRIEQALHEYSVQATVSVTDRVITSIKVAAGALPSGDCPAALLAVSSLVGSAVDNLEEQTRTTLRGTAGCTHLNDVLLSFADLWSIIPADGRPYTHQQD